MALKTETLQAQGLTQEQINYVMAEHHKELNSLKADRDDLNSRLQDAQKELKGFEGVNVSELRGKIDQLTSDLANKDKEYQDKIADRDFNDLLKENISASGARNVKAVMALMDQATLKSSKNQKEDIAKELERVKKENDYLFEGRKQAPRFVSTTEGPNPDATDKKTQANEALRSLFGKE